MRHQSGMYPFQVAWVVLKVMGPFWLQITQNGPCYLGVPKRDLNFGNYPHTAWQESLEMGVTDVHSSGSSSGYNESMGLGACMFKGSR